MFGNLVPFKGNLRSGTPTAEAITGRRTETPNGPGTGKHVTQILSYPESVSSDPMQGHYIIFEILTQNRAQMTGQKLYNDIETAVTSVATAAVEAVVAVAPTIAGGGVTPSSRTPTSAVDRNKPNSLRVAHQATTSLSTVIALYMPPSVSVEYKMNYGEHEIGAVAEGANAMISAFSGGDGRGAAMSGAKTAAALAANIGKTFADGVAQGTSDILQIHAGSIITPRMELMFEGLSRRNFSYNFTFLPKSVKEAKTVEEIVKLFKFHSASDYGGALSGIMGGPDGVRTMTIPDIFDIKYMHMGTNNTHLNKIKTCVLSNISVEYGAERYTAYDEGRPQTTKLALSFTELELITKTYIADGY